MSVMFSLVSVNHVYEITNRKYRLDSVNVIMVSPYISELKSKMHKMFLECMEDGCVCELNQVRRENNKADNENGLGIWREEPVESETLDYIFYSDFDELTHCEVCIAPHVHCELSVIPDLQNTSKIDD